MRIAEVFGLAAVICLSLVAGATDNLVYGIPGPSDKVIDRRGYALGYRAAWKTARWVTYRLTADEVQNQVVMRVDDFEPDPMIAGGPQLEDYRGSGYDRGHLAPAADMKWSSSAMKECFYLSNMVPQDRGNNSGIWNEIENTVPVGSRKAAPVCDKWPDTGWWLSTNSNKRHNRKCENYRKTRGYPCRKDEGVPCKKCGG